MEEIKEKTLGWDVYNLVGFRELLVQHPDEQLWGGMNVAPVGWKEVSEEEFAKDHYHVDYPALAHDYRQIHRLNDGTPISPYIPANLYINGFGKGWAIERRHREGKVKYFFFELCAHDYETLEKRMSWWKGKCKKCGCIHVIDSSD